MQEALGDRTADLPWLCPCAASLTALARDSVRAAWSRVQVDPGCVCLVVRYGLPDTATLGVRPVLSTMREVDVLRAARDHLRDDDAKVGFVPWDVPELRSLHQGTIRLAQLACHLAHVSHKCTPELAWIGGLLAPLGWFAGAVFDSGVVARCLDECQKDSHVPLWVTQNRHFGMDVAAMARRLNQRWGLPSWLAAVTGHLGMPSEVAQTLGADIDLFLLIQLANGLLAEHRNHIPLACGHTTDEAARRLGLDREDVHRWAREYLTNVKPIEVDSVLGRNPREEPLLVDLITLAAENRRLQQRPQTEHLHRDIDGLHDAIREYREVQEKRLEERKLTAIAEFAAGAAHEINNPLAVISGQAQHLLQHEGDQERREKLEKIVKQTKRVHRILTELRQFARPAEPRFQQTDAGVLMLEAVGTCRELAQSRNVQLVHAEPPTAVTFCADPAKVVKALTCLLQNAIEAAPEDGWASIHLELPQPDVLHFVIEDNGHGPTPADRHLLFDPFFSGRDAGRGRGLGLPVAWRMATLHGGDVFLAPNSHGKTQFVLRLPLGDKVPLNNSNNGRNGFNGRSLAPSGG